MKTVLMLTMVVFTSVTSANAHHRNGCNPTDKRCLCHLEQDLTIESKKLLKSLSFDTAYCAKDSNKQIAAIEPADPIDNSNGDNSEDETVDDNDDHSNESNDNDHDDDNSDDHSNESNDNDHDDDNSDDHSNESNDNDHDDDNSDDHDDHSDDDN